MCGQARSPSTTTATIRITIHFDPLTLSDARDLKVGTEISASAIFDGRIYKASQVRVERKKKVRKNQSARKRSSTNANRG